MQSWYKIAQEDQENFSKKDQDYLQAIEAGDIAKAQQMVDMELNAKGYTIGPVYHGSPNKEFTRFNIPSKGFNSNVFGSWDVSRNAAFFTEDQSAASGYARGGSTRRFFLTGSFADLRKGLPEGVFNSLVAQGVNDRWLSQVGSWEMFDKEQDPDAIFTKALKNMGYDGAIILDTDGTAGFDSYAVIDPDVIALAEPVVYNEKRETVPLSRRFN